MPSDDSDTTNVKSIFLCKVDGTAWVILAGGSVIIILLHWLGAIDAQLVDWRKFATIFGVGGLVCFVCAAIVAIWEKAD